MDSDNYEFLCSNPHLAIEMGVSEHELKRICKELKKDDMAHNLFEAEIEGRICALSKYETENEKK